jgi:hypothetical protein
MPRRCRPLPDSAKLGGQTVTRANLRLARGDARTTGDSRTNLGLRDVAPGLKLKGLHVGVDGLNTLPLVGVREGRVRCDGLALFEGTGTLLKSGVSLRDEFSFQSSVYS